MEKSTIEFWIDLPMDSAWNRNTLHFGAGGYDGKVITADTPHLKTVNARQRGYLVIGSDSGHQGEVTPGLSFAIDNPDGLDNFLFASIPKVQAAAIDTAKLLCGVAPQRRYFYEASTGGREVLQQAQRFAQDYDGVAVLMPVAEQISLLQKTTQIAQLGFLNSSAGQLTPGKVKLLGDATLAACDAEDGLADGLISNAEACNFDAHALRCPDGVDSGGSGLSDAQIATASAIRSRTDLPAPLANGVATAPAFGVRAETDPDAGLSRMQTGFDAKTPGILVALADDWLKYAVSNNADTSVLSYALGSDAARWMAFSERGNATNPDLNGFADRGGKLILWHGWSDHLVMPGLSIDYYKSVVGRLGQSRTDSFMRFYMTPGVTHGGTGPGAIEVDWLTAPDDWIEKS